VRSFRVVRSAALGILIAVGLPDAYALDPGRSLLQYRYDRWGPDEGIGHVNDIEQTADGFLWLATAEGLYRWDGAAFVRKPLRAAEAETVQVLHEDARGDLWAGLDPGLAVVSRSGEVRVYGERDGLPPGRLFALATAPGGALWVGTTAGLYKGAGGRFTLDTTCADLGGLKIWDLAPTRDGALWVGTRGGGVRRIADGACASYGAEHGLPQEVVVALHEDGRGTLWAGTQGGLSRWDGERFHSLDGRGGVSPDAVRSLASDRDGNLWIGTATAGLRRLAPDGGIASFGEREGLGANRVFALHEDREGSLWIATRAGLERLQDGAFVPLVADGRVLAPTVRTLLPARAGGVWIGTEGQGLLRVSAGSVRESFTSKHGLPEDTAAPLVETPDGRLWLGTGRGLYVLDHGRLQRMSGRSGLGEENVRAAVVDRRGHVWIGTNGDGLYEWDGAAFTHRSPPDTVLALHQDAQGALWVGTSGAGVRRLDSERALAYTTKEGLSSGIVTGFLETGGALWMSTGRGLTRERDGVFSAFVADSGPLSQRLANILEDEQGFLWLTSTGGVYRLRRDALEKAGPSGAATVAYAQYTVADGLPSADCSGDTQPSGWRAPDGTLWIPTRRGVGIVDPRRLDRPPVPMPIRVETLVADSRRLPAVDGTRLAAGLSALEIHWVGLSLRVPAKNVFKYRLLGYDMGWVDVGDRRVARFGPLPPGDYTFRVIGASSDGAWNTEGARVSFTVLPFFHQTALFKVMVAAAVAGAAMGLHRLRLRRLRARYTVVFAERNRIARELHDTLDQGIAAAGMQIQVAEATLLEKPSEAASRLEQARRFLDETLEEGRRSVWALRSQALETEDGLPGAFARLARELSSGTRAALRVDVGGEPRRLAQRVEEHVLRIGQEAITNALRHGSAEHVVVALEFERRVVVMRIRDDGHGFDTAAPVTGVGLRGMRERAAEMGASLDVRSRPGVGTETTLTVPAR
jgi:signal transduction histidine kinase/ligand-binding sensor domain-containing protein